MRNSELFECLLLTIIIVIMCLLTKGAFLLIFILLGLGYFLTNTKFYIKFKNYLDSFKNILND